jgi:hypothetical protein
VFNRKTAMIAAICPERNDVSMMEAVLFATL